MKLDRRTLLIGGGAGIGLIVGYALWPRGLSSALTPAEGERTFGQFIKIARDGRVTVAVPQVETGQGTWTGLAQVVADELGADWNLIAVEPAPLTAAYSNPLMDGTRITANATSIRAFEQPMRRAAAVARTMLIAAAAGRWDTDPADCEAADGLILHDGNSLTFGELAEEAAEQSAPREPILRGESKARLMGRPLERVDARAKTSGRWRFAGDVRLPGMLFAAVRLAPPGGRLIGFSREGTRAVRGAGRLVARDGWIAITASNQWTAERAIRAANPRFSGKRSDGDVRAAFDQAFAEADFHPTMETGDFAAAAAGSRPLAATYFVAPSQHLGLEPLTATARVRGSHAEVWAPTVAPDLAHAAMAKASKMSPSEVTFYPMPPGDPAGRTLGIDLGAIAIALARTTGKPVQVALAPSANQNHAAVSAGALMRKRAVTRLDGIPAALAMQVATTDDLGALQPQALEGATPPYAIPNLLVEACPAAVHFSVGYMRGSPQREMTFATESFVDELARRAGLEPLAFRMAMLGNNGRLARCLQAATRLAQWDGGAMGSTMGIAGCSAFGSHIGLVATASIGPDQRIKTHRLVAAVDCGRVVNSRLVSQQVEAAMIWGLAQAATPTPEPVAGMARARSIGRMELPRIADVPEIVVQIIPSSYPPGGINGLGSTVVAPAVANAIFAGTGRRLRDLPFDPMSAA